MGLVSDCLCSYRTLIISHQKLGESYQMAFQSTVSVHAVGGRKKRRLLVQILIQFLVCFIVAALPLVAAGSAMADESGLGEALKNGSILLDARARVEVVDDADRALEKGRASTLRVRIGYETGEYQHFRALVEGEFVQRVGFATFNDTVNAKTGFAVVADPNVTQLNRAQLTYTGIPDSIVIVGRQRITLDNGRFVGSDGFRQNEQTFDAVRVINNSFADTTLSYTFIAGVNRIFGGDSPVGRLTGETHLFQAVYAGLPVGIVTGYVYLVDLEQAPELSSKTFGARMTGIRHPWDRVQITYGLEYATQRSYGRNPVDFDLGYIMGEVGAAYDGEREAISLNAKIEWLDGDGAFRTMGGFTTPLASLHEFQGFADLFSTTPQTGVQDAQITVAYDMKNLNFASNLRFAVWYHKYSVVADEGSLGREVNLAVISTLTKRLDLTVQYADFNAGDDGVERDREIIWATLAFKY